MPQGAKNGDFRNQFPILTHNFLAKCMDFEPSNAITYIPQVVEEEH
jgi:hypothetical protein